MPMQSNARGKRSRSQLAGCISQGSAYGLTTQVGHLVGLRWFRSGFGLAPVRRNGTWSCVLPGQLRWFVNEQVQ